jgi:hypothetical protein
VNEADLTPEMTEGLVGAEEVLVEALRPLCGRVESIYRLLLDKSLAELAHNIEQRQMARTPNEFASLPEDGSQDLLVRVNALRMNQKSSLFDRTLALRRSISMFLEDQPGFRVVLARWIVRSWGKVDRGNTYDYPTLASEAESRGIHSALGTWEYDRVACWSKYLAFRSAKTAAIYDSRVVYSLNWFLRAAKNTKRFPRLPSRNRLISLFDYTLINAVDRLGWKQFALYVETDFEGLESGDAQKSRIFRAIEPARDSIGTNVAYAYYIRLIGRVAQTLFPDDEDWRLTKTEMTLFGAATTVVPRQVLEWYAKFGGAEI